VFAADRLKSSSPNSGHPEAAAAGALGVQLGGPASYFGETSFKPIIGAGLVTAGPRHILEANRLIIASGLLFFSACCGAHSVVLYFI
jgi:adenosylcobinamide-phosphate synthase